MKYVFLFLVLSCASDDKDYKQMSNNQKAFTDEKNLETDANTRDQFPTTQPTTNQSQSF
jgi:hypothetical protein